MKNRKQYIAALTLAVLVLSLGGCGKSKQQSYDSARNLYFYGQYSEARKAFKNLEDYQDSAAMVTACDYQLAMQQLSDGEYLGRLRPLRPWENMPIPGACLRRRRRWRLCSNMKREIRKRP